MGQLFRFEFRKLFRQKSFYICGCVLIGLILLTAITLNMIYSLSQGNMEAGGVTVSASDDGFLYTGIYMLVGAVSSSNFTIVLAIFLSLFVCSDYTNGTLKNIIARGYSRTRIYAVKYMVSLGCHNILYHCLLAYRIPCRHCILGSRKPFWHYRRPDCCPAFTASWQLCIHLPVLPDCSSF